jgi:hypothetical protein
MTEPSGYFAQMTDLHVGSAELLSQFAERHVEEAFRELAALEPRPGFVLVTGDVISGGTKDELRRYRELAADFPLPLWHQAANHDLWGDAAGPGGWDAMMGDRRHCFDHNGVRFLLVHEYKRRDDGSWFAHMSADDLDWLRGHLESWGTRPVVVAQHSPILRLGGEYVDVWANSNADEYLALLAEHNVLALITGHWHRNMAWEIGPRGSSRTIPLISTGTLMGQQWTGYPPHYFFATRPGYRLFGLEDGRLRTFWRELRADPQVILPWVGPAYTQGPHPQVRVPIVRGKVRLGAQSCAFGGRVASVEWALCTEENNEGYKTEWRIDAWKPMRCTFEGLWSDWEADFDPSGLEPATYVVALRARSAAGKTACEGTPVIVRPGPDEPAAVQGNETVFALFYPPAE